PPASDWRARSIEPCRACCTQPLLPIRRRLRLSSWCSAAWRSWRAISRRVEHRVSRRSKRCDISDARELRSLKYEVRSTKYESAGVELCFYFRLRASDLKD